MKKKLIRWAITFTVLVLLLASTVSMPADEVGNPNRQNTIGKLEINHRVSTKYSPIPTTIDHTEPIKASIMPKNKGNQLGIDVPVMDFSDGDTLNPHVATDKGNNVLVAGEYIESTLDSNIHFRFSKDAGNSWLPEDGTIFFDYANAGYLTEKPVVDYSGDLGGIGSCIDINCEGLIQIDFDDITDPDSWESLSWNVNDPVYSVDVAGWNSRFSPFPEYSKGVLVFTGDIQGTTNVLYLLWSNSESGGTGCWTGSGDDDYEWSNVKSDNDLVTGIHWEAYEVSSNLGEHEDGIEIEWCQLDATDDWWTGDWYYILLEGAKNPDIDAENGNTYCVFEYNGGISCAYTKDNGDNFNNFEVASSGYNPHVSISGNNIVITYIKNGDLVSVFSEDSGITWEENIVNDQRGSVVDESHSSHIAGSYITWTNEDQGRTSIYFDVVSLDIPIIEIESISGGFGVKASITNTGTAEATNIPWSISLDGGAFIGQQTTGSISRLSPGQTETIKSSFIIGFGKTDLTINAGSTTSRAQGTVLLFFVLGV